MQSTLLPTPRSRINLDRVETALAELLADALRRGFHGKAALELTINDGTIQHIRRTLERIER